MESTPILVGIVGLQLTIAAGLTAILGEISPAAEGSLVTLMWGSVLVTGAGFVLGRSE